MREIAWHEGNVEVRFEGEDSRQARYALVRAHRTGKGSLFHADYDPAFSSLRLPAAIVPCVGFRGEAIDVATKVRELGGVARAAKLFLLPGHAPIVARDHASEDPEILDAMWITGLELEQLGDLRAITGALAGVYVAEDESVVGLGHDLPEGRWLYRLPRVVLGPTDLSARL